MSITIAALVAMGIKAAADAAPAIQEGVSNAAPVIQRALTDALKRSMKDGTLKTLVKGTDWGNVKTEVKTEIENTVQGIADGVEKVRDYWNYNDDQGGWTKK